MERKNLGDYFFDVFLSHKACLVHARRSYGKTEVKLMCNTSIHEEPTCLDITTMAQIEAAPTEEEQRD
jgi:hypothetical protein